MSQQHLLIAYGVVPLWILAGWVDWLCHRRSHIEDTSGTPESALHLLLLEVGPPLLAVLYLEVDALILGVFCAAFVAHEITAFIDVRYAAPRRRIGVVEQFAHSVLEMAPLMVLLLAASAHWPQWLALWGLGDEPARGSLAASREAPPAAYSVGLVIALVVLGALPYLEELSRSLRARRES